MGLEREEAGRADEDELAETPGGDPWDSDEPNVLARDALAKTPRLAELLDRADLDLELPEFVLEQLDEAVNDVAERVRGEMTPEELEGLRELARASLLGPGAAGGR